MFCSSRPGTRISFFLKIPTSPEIYTLSLHDALPISAAEMDPVSVVQPVPGQLERLAVVVACPADRKSTRLNSSHQIISYAVSCLKKKRPKSVCLMEERRAPQPRVWQIA